ncbi:hypothetical protein DSO57_1010207 [Entomophthora muscae]|uniref:Uncharacterized protein n=1 Tax=Entomophthora muscae TaxID=34485 RepID=A0ACC2RL99_9FUNG|nr:hypothetical protein DSO57_1010207 [Entomophthora muscae]
MDGRIMQAGVQDVGNKGRGLKMSRVEMYRILFSLAVVGVSGEQAPGIYGVGCAAIRDSLYVMGGSVAAGEKEPNRKVYKMELSELSPPQWEETSFVIPNDAMYVGVAPAANDSRLLMLGGKNVDLNKGFYSFGPDDSKFTPLNPPSTIISSVTQEKLTKYPYGGGFVQTAPGSSEYIFYGGYEINSKGGNATTFMYRYDASRNTWRDDKAKGGPQTFFNTGTVYNNALYVVGGSDAKENIMPLSKVWRYDFVRAEWANLNTNGIDPGNRAHHSAVVVGNRLYVVGGQNIQRINDRIDILNLDTLTWSTKQVSGLSGKLQGCLVHHKGNLMYGFGYSDPFTSKPLSVNLKTFKISQPRDPTPAPIIVGATVGGIIAILLTITAGLLCCKARRIRKDTAEMVAKYDEQVRQYNAPIPCPHLETVPQRKSSLSTLLGSHTSLASTIKQPATTLKPGQK